MTGKLRASSGKSRLGITFAVPTFLWQSWYTGVVPLVIVTNGPTFNQSSYHRKAT